METAIIEGFVKQGVLGLVVAALGVIVWRLFVIYDRTQEKRIAEGQASVRAIEQNTSALQALTQLVRDRRVGRD